MRGGGAPPLNTKSDGKRHRGSKRGGVNGSWSLLESKECYGEKVRKNWSE